MARWQGPVLIDTNVIIEAWRIDAWRALCGGYSLQTVLDCVIETQTGYQKRRPEQRIDESVLRAGLKHVHTVSDVEHAAAIIRDGDIALLDLGEKSLWAHALARTDAWVLCGPDKASLRIGIRAGLRDRLVSLERLLSDAGYRPKVQLKTAYGQEWLSRTLVELAQREGKIA